MLNTARSRQRSGAEDNEDISQAKIAALTAYMDVIGSFLSTVETWLDKDPELSPAKRLQKKLKAFPNGVPNGGSHWVDWIPESMKQPVVQLFDAVPYNEGCALLNEIPLGGSYQLSVIRYHLIGKQSAYREVTSDGKK